MSDSWVTHQPPALDIDARMKERHGGKLSNRGLRERQAVAYILDKLQERGYTLKSVHDSEEDTPATTTKEAMELIFNLDDSRVYVTKDGDHAGSLLFVLGNEPEEVLCDWSWAPGERGEAFNKAVDEISDELGEP